MINDRRFRRVGLQALALAVALLPRAAAGDTPTFNRDVAPVFFAYCVQCHQPDGAAPFSLTAFATARRHATQIAAAMGSHAMPPWQAEPEAGEFIGQPRPTPAEIDLVSRWVAAGAPEGPRGNAPRPPPRSGRWRLGTPDLVITPPAPFLLPAEGSDVFRILVLPIPGEQLRRVRAIEFVPGNAAVHHANIRIDRTNASRALDAGDPLPGYDGLLARSALFPDGHFLGWTPGQAAPFLPRGMAWPLAPGSDLVIQLHLQPSGKTEPILPAVGFYFTDEPTERTPAMVRLGRQNIDIPAGVSSYTVTDAYTLPVDAELIAVQPHAHYRARTIRGAATLPDGSRRWLMLITRWNFRWQHLYRLRTPLPLPRGTVLTMEYVYDNSDGNPQNPQRPAARAVWGQRTNEEMGDLWLQFLTATDADRLRLNQDFRPKAVSEDLVGYDSLIQRDPGNAGLHDDAAVLSLEIGRVPAAVEHFRASASLRPASAAAQFNLGTVLALDQALDGAVAAFTRALAIDPKYAAARHQLALTLRRLGRRDESMAALRTLVRDTPDSVPGLLDLAWLLATERDFAASPGEAIALAERAVMLTGRQDAAAFDTLGVAYASAAQFERAIAAAEMALTLAGSGPIADDIRARLAGYRVLRPYLR